MPEDPTPPAPAAANAEPAPEPPQANPEPTPPPATSTDESWREQAERRKRQLEAAQAELDELRRTQMSEQDKAVADAKAAGRTEALTEAGERVAAAEVKAALTGIVPDPTAVVVDLNMRKFLTDDGEVDAAKVADLRAKYQAFAPAAVRQPTAAPQGGGAPTPTLDEQIAAAQAAGDTKKVIHLNGRKLAELAGK